MKSSTEVALSIKAEEFVTIKNRSTKLVQLSTARLEDYMNKVKPEAAYFFEADGNRVMAFVTDMQSADQIPALAEPLFQGMDANVEFHPVMNFDELKKGLVLFQKGTFSSVIPRQQIEYQMNQ